MEITRRFHRLNSWLAGATSQVETFKILSMNETAIRALSEIYHSRFIG